MTNFNNKKIKMQIFQFPKWNIYQTNKKQTSEMKFFFQYQRQMGNKLNYNKKWISNKEFFFFLSTSLPFTHIIYAMAMFRKCVTGKKTQGNEWERKKNHSLFNAFNRRHLLLYVNIINLICDATSWLYMLLYFAR